MFLSGRMSVRRGTRGAWCGSRAARIVRHGPSL